MPSSDLCQTPLQARCSKCRKTTDHNILTIDETGPLQVQCTNCGRKQKNPQLPPTKATVRRRTQSHDETVLRHKVAERKEWQDLRPDMNSADATTYSMTAAYKAKALINHPVFGLGLVQRVMGAQKVEVLFEDGRKTMRCK